LVTEVLPLYGVYIIKHLQTIFMPVIKLYFDVGNSMNSTQGGVKDIPNNLTWRFYQKNLVFLFWIL